MTDEVTTESSIHRTLRQCERSLYAAHSDCATLAGTTVSCVCGRAFVHVHSVEEGCYWALRGRVV